MNVVNNKAKNRYELDVNGYVAILEYVILDDGTLKFVHTEVPMELQGQGIAAMLVESTLEDIKRNQQKIISACSYLDRFLENHPQWLSVVK